MSLESRQMFSYFLRCFSRGHIIALSLVLIHILVRILGVSVLPLFTTRLVVGRRRFGELFRPNRVARLLAELDWRRRWLLLHHLRPFLTRHLRLLTIHRLLHHRLLARLRHHVRIALKLARVLHRKTVASEQAGILMIEDATICVSVWMRN